MNEWLILQGITNPQLGLLLGLIIGGFGTVLVAWLLSRRNAVLATRLSDREQHHLEQVHKLQEAENRLTENFERLAGRIFEDRSEKLSDLNTRQLDVLLKPLSEKIIEFRRTVEHAHKEETAQHRVMKEKIGDLEKLNERLHRDATDLTQALTSNVKAQGSWGEQQLERLLELSGLRPGREYSAQFSVTAGNGQRLQPDFVMHLPEGRSIVLDSKVSLLAWVRYQSAQGSADERVQALKEHTRSIRQHIKGLAEKKYAEAPELNALDFVLMFVPIESALIEALQSEPELAEFALRHKVALLAPTSFLATLSTVASVWSVHRQNRNAQEIARRAGLLYDKFAGFVANLQLVGDRLRQAQQSYDTALGQLSSGAGNLLRQAELLRQLGARSSMRIDPELVERSEEGDSGPE